jgi:hypothetical protein
VGCAGVEIKEVRLTYGENIDQPPAGLHNLAQQRERLFHQFDEVIVYVLQCPSVCNFHNDSTKYPVFVSFNHETECDIPSYVSHKCFWCRGKVSKMNESSFIQNAMVLFYSSGIQASVEQAPVDFETWVV